MVVNKQAKMGSENVDHGRARMSGGAFSTPFVQRGVLKQMVSVDRRLRGAVMNTLKTSQVKPPYHFDMAAVMSNRELWCDLLKMQSPLPYIANLQHITGIYCEV